MPLLDHFHPPLSVQRPWEGIHSAWASTLAAQLNKDQLPPDYFAMPLVTVGGRVEVDVATFEETTSSETGNGAVATQVWAPPRPLLSAIVDLGGVEAFEVHVMQEMGGPKLRATIELVSPANKDRPSHRRAFAVKCAAYLQRGIAVVVIDVVTERTANLHAELIEVLGQPSGLDWQSPTDLYAASYRAAIGGEQDRLDLWAEALQVGTALPTLPLWLSDELCLPLRLEGSYVDTCASLRVQM